MEWPRTHYNATTLRLRPAVRSASFGASSIRRRFNGDGDLPLSRTTIRSEGVTAVFLTQLLPSSTLPVRSQLRQLVYQALVD